jgi:uncharacterized protein (DUF2141 family)
MLLTSLFALTSFFFPNLPPTYSSIPLPSSITLSVTIDNCKNSKGKIYIALYGSEETFMKEEKAVNKKIVSIENGVAKVAFAELSAKGYAFVFFHDENGNGKLDTNFLGIPTEGYGFSNNARGTFGPPSYSKSRVILKEGVNRATVQLNY